MLKSIEYYENYGEQRYWRLNRTDLINKNLVVGRNATGKSRLISVIFGLCNLLAGKQTELFESGVYDVELELASVHYRIHIAFEKKQVVMEELRVDGEVRLQRRRDGKGKIWYEKQNSFIDFDLPTNALAFQLRRDELQHPFVSRISAWASQCLYFPFGSADRTILRLVQTLGVKNGAENHACSKYIQAFNEFGVDLDKRIIKDMLRLGYKLEDVGVGDMKVMAPHAGLPDGVLSLYVREADRPGQKVTQIEMSEGMYRALSLVINLNIAALSKFKGLILVDDIGEGLDYERSTGLIDLLLSHAKKNVQVVMTTNDRFVMNKVPLENWCILRRIGPIVSSFTQRNSAEEFDAFKFAGLSNFDFFTSNVFETK